MTRGRAILAASLALALVAAIGLGARVVEAPLLRFHDAPLSSAAVALPTILLAGLADGINPCAFTLLLLFVATIASLYRGPQGASLERRALRDMRARMLLYGGAFILAIFTTYLALGTGLLQTSTALTQNHLGARLAALLSLFLGLWMVKDYFAPGWGPRLGAPPVVGKLVHSWGQQTSLSAMLGLGVLVGLCTVPCSGAVYLAVVSMLALQQGFAQSYLYLVLYNVMFVTPLVAILAAATARPTLNRMAHWNLHHREGVRLALGASVVALGLVILATV